jgi:hypothetical protein
MSDAWDVEPPESSTSAVPNGYVKLRRREPHTWDALDGRAERVGARASQEPRIRQGGLVDCSPASRSRLLPNSTAMASRPIPACSPSIHWKPAATPSA